MTYTEHKGDLLQCTEPVIIQQLNCLCVRPHGLSESIATRYPYANVYDRRRALGRQNRCVAEDEGKTGEIVVCEPYAVPGPVVIGLYGQFDYGRGYGSHRTPQTMDNASLREKWFREALEKLAQYLHAQKINSVGVPYAIGCGLAGGDWSVYEQMLRNFSVQNNINVNVYRL